MNSLGKTFVVSLAVFCMSANGSFVNVASALTPRPAEIVSAGYNAAYSPLAFWVTGRGFHDVYKVHLTCDSSYNGGTSELAKNADGTLLTFQMAMTKCAAATNGTITLFDGNGRNLTSTPVALPGTTLKITAAGVNRAYNPPAVWVVADGLRNDTVVQVLCPSEVVGGALTVSSDLKWGSYQAWNLTSPTATPGSCKVTLVDPTTRVMSNSFTL